MLESINDNVLQEDLEMIANSDLEFSKFKNSNILITGGTGLVGSLMAKTFACCNRIQKLNLNIFVFVRNFDKAKKVYGELLERSDFNVIQGDILNDLNNVIDNSINFDYIIHTACITSSHLMVEKPVDVINVSLNGTMNVFEFAKLNDGCKVIYISSMEVYGRFNEKTNVDESMLGQIDLYNVRSNYPESKRMCENMALAYYKQFQIPIYIARLTQTFGAGILTSENRVFAQFAKSAIAGDDIVLHTDGSSEGNYCYTRDMIMGILTILLKGEVCTPYNIVNENNHCSIREMAELVCQKIAQDDIKVIYDIPQSNIYGYASASNLFLRSTKLRELGWKPTVDLENSYKRMVESMVNTSR